MSVVRYMTVSELVYINGSVLGDLALLSGTKQVRAFDLLDAAAARPASSAFGDDAYPTLREKAAAMFHSLVRNHPFTDGNKRTATVALVLMLRVNGYDVAWKPGEALTMILDVAERRCEMAAFAAWLPVVLVDEGWLPDAERDKSAIEQIRGVHRWLLDELAQR